MTHNKLDGTWKISKQEFGIFLYYLMCGYQYMVDNIPERKDEAERLKKWIENAEKLISMEKKQTEKNT